MTCRTGDVVRITAVSIRNGAECIRVDPSHSLSWLAGLDALPGLWGYPVVVDAGLVGHDGIVRLPSRRGWGW